MTRRPLPPSPDRAPPAGRLLPLAALLVAMVSVQAGAAFAKSLFPVVGAAGTTALRLLLSGLIMAVVLQPWRTPLIRGKWRDVTIYGAALGSMNLLFYSSLTRIPLGTAVAIEFTGPLAVVVLASRRRLDLAWAALAIVGLVLLLPVGRNHAALDPVGIGLALAAGACWALYIVYGKRAGADHGARAPLLGTLVGTAIVLPIGLVGAGPALFDPKLLPAALLVATLSSAIPYSLEMIALRRLPAQTFGTLMSGEPALAALAGLAMLGEVLLPLQLLAIGLIIVASLGATLTGR